MANFCNACGKEIEPGVKFCGSCGAPIDAGAVGSEADAAAAGGGNTGPAVTQTTVNAASGAAPDVSAGVTQGVSAGATVNAASGAASEAPSGSQQSTQQIIDKLMKIAQNTADHSEGMDPADVEKNKIIGCFAYIIFFLPLVAVPDSKFGRFHANQGLVYLILFVAASIATTVIRMMLVSITWGLLWLSSLISFLVFVPVIAIGVVGLVNGYTGKAKDLPLIGTIRLLK